MCVCIHVFLFVDIKCTCSMCDGMQIGLYSCIIIMKCVCM